MATQQLSTRCCIVGGGPCGLMLGFLLARAGVDVVVLEKHADFFRDFRGDTIHPSTLEVMSELGLFDAVPQAAAPEGAHHQRILRQPGIRLRGFHPSADPRQVHRADAAVGLPQFHCRAGQELSDVPSAHAGGRGRPDRGGRPRRRRARQYAGRRARRARRPDGRMRRPPLDRARARRARGRGARRADGRAVVPAAEKGQRPRRDDGPLRRRAHHHPDRPRRLLAMRLPHSQGRDRGNQARRAAGVPAERGKAHARIRGPRRRTRRTGTRSSS